MAPRPLGVIAVLAAAAILTGCASGGDGQTVHEAYASHQARVAAQSAPTAARTATPAAATPATAPAPAAPRAEQVTVTRVKDGDTFELADGRTVRVLGIDSCEADTYGGQRATDMARAAFDNPGNQPVTLTREPGVDRDRYGRALRYVQLAGTDFGLHMVAASHTGVYEGRNDAGPAYIAELAAADSGERECSAPPASTPEPDRDVYVDTGDDDGESRFCSRRWYC